MADVPWLPPCFLGPGWQFYGGEVNRNNNKTTKRKNEKTERVLGIKGKNGEDTTQLGVGGGRVGVRGWPCPGGRYTRIPDPGRGHTPPRGGKRICRSGPEKEGGPFIKICTEVVVLSLCNISYWP
jgi:hypothetical protein